MFEKAARCPIAHFSEMMTITQRPDENNVNVLSDCCSGKTTNGSGWLKKSEEAFKRNIFRSHPNFPTFNHRKFFFLVSKTQGLIFALPLTAVALAKAVILR